MNQVPGVRTNLDVGSSGLGDTVEFRLYGQLGSPWQMVEGVLASAPTLLGAQGSHVDFNAVDGTRVQTVGANAEMPRRGLLVDSVIKSGGNDFHGTCRRVRVGRGTRGRQHRATSSRRRASGWPKLHTVQDFAGTLGGRIVRNKLWFFGGARYEKVERDILDAFDPDGTPITNIKKGDYYFAKALVSGVDRQSPHRLLPLDQRLRTAECEQVRPAGIDGREGQSGHDCEGRMADRARQRAGRLGPVRAMELQGPRL